ncbi:MAG: tautomerase family protein [Chloroflexi bacterium]|nr:tautomerase family protein [Chloroflexota bacterium]
MPTIIIYWSPGRTDDQKARVAEKITQVLVDEGGAKLEDVLIIFQKIESGNTARAGKLVMGSLETMPKS